MATVTQNKLTQSLCVLRVMIASKKIRLDRPAITEILVADTTLNQVLRLAMTMNFMNSKKKNKNKNKKPQHKMSPKLQQVAGGHQPGDRLKERT